MGTDIEREKDGFILKGIESLYFCTGFISGREEILEIIKRITYIT